MARICRGISPEFEFFDEAARTLRSTYDLNDEDTLKNTPSALANLLFLAEMNLSELAAAVHAGSISDIHTLIRRSNQQIQSVLQKAWKQSELSVELSVNGSTLQVLIVEHADNTSVTDFAERSDGLRMFVALACFVIKIGKTTR